MRTRYKTYADYGMLKSDEEKTRERCMKASAEERLIILQCVISAAPGLEMAIYDSITSGFGYRTLLRMGAADTGRRGRFLRVSPQNVGRDKQIYETAGEVEGMMEIKITPRKPDEVGGYLMMPLVANVPNGRKGWKIVKCPECGAACWYRSGQEQVRAIAVCTMCALKHGLGR